MATVPASALDRYERLSLYNSPYAAHDRGCAVDLYPPGAVAAEPGSRATAPSPVAGEVVDARTVSAPTRPYAVERDHLLLVDAGDRIARVLHVDPAVEPGDRVAVGDDLGSLVRSGYFAPWVDDHLHLEFRPPGADPYRASGSVPIDPGVAVEPLAWDGTGRVVETGETYAVLDAPEHPAPGERWVGVATALDGATDGTVSLGGAADDGASSGGTVGVLDGGLPHYDGGGLLGAEWGESTGSSRPVDSCGPVGADEPAHGAGSAGAGGSAGADEPAGASEPVGAGGSVEGGGPVELLGTVVGTARSRDVTWSDVTVLANGRPVAGLSLFVARDVGFGAKLICPDRTLAVGERVTVELDAP